MLQSLRHAGGYSRHHDRLLRFPFLRRNSGGEGIRNNPGDRPDDQSVHFGVRFASGFRLGAVEAGTERGIEYWDGSVGKANRHHRKDATGADRSNWQLASSKSSWSPILADWFKIIVSNDERQLPIANCQLLIANCQLLLSAPVASFAVGALWPAAGSDILRHRNTVAPCRLPKISNICHDADSGICLWS